MSSFGNNLKNLRELNGLSQKNFARLIGTTQQRISEWELDKVEPTLYNIIKIVKVLNVTFEEIIEGVTAK